MLFPSPEWTAAWVEACNADVHFRDASVGWDGAAGCVIAADESLHIPTQYLRLEGRDGTWTSHELGEDPQLVTGTKFVLSADYLAWKSVIRQELHPIRAMVMGRVRVKGQLSAVLRWSRPLVLMTQIAGRLHTTFTDEQR